MRALCTIVTGVSLVLVNAGCKDKSDDSKDKLPRRTTQPASPTSTKAKPTPRPSRASPRARVERKLRDCLFVANATPDTPPPPACHADDAVFRLSDSIPDIRAVGADAMLAAEKRVSWRAFPDASRTRVSSLIKGREAVFVWHVAGSHTAPDGNILGVPANQAKVGMLVATYVSYSAKEQITERMVFFDQLTMLGQLGAKVAHRPAYPAPAGEPVVALAAGYGTEAKNLQIGRALLREVHLHVPRDMANYYAEDATLWSAWLPETAVGKQAIEDAWNTLFAGSTDVKNTPKRTWATGDYVIMRTVRDGTNTDAALTVHPGGARLPTGKPYRLQELHILRLENSVIKEHWIFANRYTWAAQIGMVTPAQPSASK